MNKLWRYLIFLAWISYLLSSGLFLFIDGFFLHRIARPERSSCIHCSNDTSCKSEKIFQNIHETEIFCLPPRSRVVLLVVDALKYEFLEWHDEKLSDSSYYLNKIPVVSELLQSHPHNTRLYKFMADPPTTTMQRLKALTTGTLPTFIDVGSNFATDAINEDNLVDLTHERGGAVFMGDDTWTLLFPGKFLRQFPSPSFNVWDLDTVDDEVRHRIAFELKKKDWAFLIAHTLGVDHCGHKYGQHHPEMARKLNDTNRLIREIIDGLDDDMILFVIGDHGMTESGDHGGDSTNENEAGMFVYSKFLPLSEHVGRAEKIVNQIDLVPTLSTILGVPIPFENIGSLIVDCLPIGSINDQSADHPWFLMHSVWINVLQTKRYIDVYSKDSFLFMEEKLKDLEEMFDEIRREAELVRDDKSFLRFYEKSRSYLKSVKDSCSEIWVQFDAGLMSKGLVLVFCTLFFMYLLINGIPEARLNEIMESYFLYFAIGMNFMTSAIIYVLYQLRLVDEFKNTNFFANGAVSISLLVILVVQNWDFISSTWYNGVRYHRFDYFQRGVLLLMICSLFSNSYIVEENKVMSFLLVTSVALLIYNAIDEDALYHDSHDRRVKIGKSFVNTRKYRTMLILIGLVACTAVRITSYFWRCREEQDKNSCTNLVIKGSFSHHEGSEKILLTVSIILLALYVTIVRTWLRNCGNLSGFSPSITIARYCPGIVVVCIGCYWVIQRLPKDAKVKLSVSWQINTLPGIVYFFVLLGIFILYSRPLGVYILPRRNESLNDYQGEDIVPKLFDTIKELFYAKREIEKPEVPVVYGLGTVYSAAFISLSVFLTLLWALLLGNALAPATFMMFVTCIAVLGIIAMERSRNANNVAELLQVPSSAILCWFLIAEYFFYGTGHQPTFPTVQWDAAFIGAGGHSYGNYLPAILIGMNTFGCYLIAAMTLPLLVIVPFTIYVMIPEIAKMKFRVDDMKNGELVLFERSATFHNALFSIYGKYILVHGIRTFGCMLTTTIHCRHLMIWKIFAPKLIFEGLSFLISLSTVLTSAFMVLRIDRRVDDLISRVAMKTR